MDSFALKSTFPAFDATIDPATELDPDTERDTRKEPSVLDEETLYVMLRHWFEDDATHSAEWRKRAHEEYDFVAGEQWSPEDKRVLEEQRRPAIVFNRAIAIIKSVAGIEINGRHETTFLPRGNDVGAVKANELLNQASQWMSDGCDAEDEQSEAFQDAVICGMGWCLSDDALVRLPNTHFATTRLYTGSVVKIDLENGKQLTGTPNHPVLTDRGWKPLHEVKEGDNLVSSAFMERVHGLPVEQFDKVETRLKDKIDAFRTGRIALRFITAPDDFYSDGSGSKVHVVYTDGELGDKLRDATLVKETFKSLLAWRNNLPATGAALPSDGLLFHAALTAESESALHRLHALTTKIAGFDDATKDMASAAHPDLNRLGGKAELVGNLLGGESLVEIQAGEFLNRDAGLPAATGALADFEPRTHKSRINAPVRYSKLIADFCDWKPLLEIEARKLFSGNVVGSGFVIRVTRRIVESVSEFPVHDVGTAVGFFIAGDVITSNTECRLDFEEDPEGIYIEEKIDPLEMYWDKNARAKNLADAKRLWRVRKFSLDEAMARFPDYPPEELDCTWARYAGQTEPTKSYEEKKFRNTEPKVGDFDRRTEVHIVQVQWWEREKYWRVADPRAARPIDLNEKQYQQLSKRAAILGMPIKAIQMTRRVYKQAFLGAQILDGVRPGPCEDRFTFNCITGEKDRNRGVWFGLVRLMRDPQMWANKWLSQTLHILNTTAKGGVLAEEDAFPDQREAEETYAQPDSITWVANGAISKGKITAKPGQGIPQAYQQLLEFAINSIPAVTGLNPELLGQRDINQPGVLEQKRKEAAMTILAGLFDALRRFRKQVGRVRLFFIQEYLSDGRIIRIAGQEGFELVPLVREKTLGKYDVIIDDAPTSPNQKQETWALLVTILPMFAQMLTPEVVVMILEYSPLPSRLIESLKGLLQKAPDPIAAQTAQAQLAAIQAAVAQQQAQAAKDQATAQRTIAGIGLDQAKAHELMAKAMTAGQDKGQAAPPPPTEKDEAETDRIRALTILALAQAAGVAGDTAVSHAKRDLLASEIDTHMNTPLGGGTPRHTPTEGPEGLDPVGRLSLPVLGQPHPGASVVGPAMGGHMPSINPLQGPQPLGGPLSGLSHLSPELLAHLAQLTGAGAPPPA